MSEALKKVDDFRRNQLRDLLGQCRPGQRELFGKMYPGGIDSMPESKLDWATQQCESTIRGNKNEDAGLGRIHT